MDLATGVIIGAAFGTIVSAFTAGIVTPLLNAVGGNADVPLTIWKFNIGLIISAAINFLITAAVIFFVIVKPANAMIAKMKAKEVAAPPPGPSDDVKLLTEIRDLLKK